MVVRSQSEKLSSPLSAPENPLQCDHSPPPNGLDFSSLNLSSLSPLLSSPPRVPCPVCNKSRRYFCAGCAVSLVPSTPSIRLPLRVEILQSAAESPQSSTASHAAILSPDARVTRPWPECADSFRREVLEGKEEGRVALLYPGEGSLSPAEAAEVLPELETLVVVDGKWAKSVKMVESAMLRGIPRVGLAPSEKGGGRMTRFWRYSPVRGDGSEMFNEGVVEGLLSTVEAIHAFCEEYSCAKGARRGACDDLLWLFVFNHGIVKNVYEGAPGKRERIMRKSKGLLREF